MSTSNKRTNYIKHIFVHLFTVMLLATAPNMASAGITPPAYDIIVPSIVEIETSVNQTSSGFGFWGWVIATDNPVLSSDLQGANFTSVSDNVDVDVVVQNFQFLPVIGTLQPGQVAGGLTTANQEYSALLGAEENLKASWANFWWIQFQFPAGYGSGVNDNASLTSSVEIGGDVISYQTFVDFNSGSSSVDIIAAQRLPTTVVPEPISAILFLAGGAIIGGRSYLKKRIRS